MAALTLVRNVINPPRPTASVSTRPSVSVSSVSFTSAYKFNVAQNATHKAYDVRCLAKGTMEEGIDKSKQIADEVKEKTKSTADTAAEKSKEGLDALANTAEGASGKANEEASKAAEIAEGIKKSAENTGGSVVDNVKEGINKAADTVKDITK